GVIDIELEVTGDRHGPVQTPFKDAPAKAKHRGEQIDILAKLALRQRDYVHDDLLIKKGGTQPEIDVGGTCRILQVRWVCGDTLVLRLRIRKNQGIANQSAARIWGARLSANAVW